MPLTLRLRAFDNKVRRKYLNVGMRTYLEDMGNYTISLNHLLPSIMHTQRFILNVIYNHIQNS
jgi:hypothetical protein